MNNNRSMKLAQAREISKLSTASTDGCTWFPDLGFRPNCAFHDRLIQHFVTFDDELNAEQEAYMLTQNLHLYVTWSQSKGKYGEPFTWKQANHLFRESLDKKIDDHRNPIKKVWYWANRNVFYFGVATWHRVRRWL